MSEDRYSILINNNENFTDRQLEFIYWYINSNGVSLEDFKNKFNNNNVVACKEEMLDIDRDNYLKNLYNSGFSQSIHGYEYILFVDKLDNISISTSDWTLVFNADLITDDNCKYVNGCVSKDELDSFLGHFMYFKSANGSSYKDVWNKIKSFFLNKEPSKWFYHLTRYDHLNALEFEKYGLVGIISNPISLKSIKYLSMVS